MLEAVLLGAGAAVGFGVSDFLSGVWSRRVGIIAVLVVGQLGGLVVIVAAGPLIAPGPAGAADLLWGAAAGVAATVGVLLLLRGFQLGRLSVVAPSSAFATAGTPLLVDIASGAELSTLSIVGMVIGLVAIWLVSSAGGEGSGPSGNALRALTFGFLSGVAFAATFLALDRSSPDSGAWPVLSAQVAITFGALVILLFNRGMSPLRWAEVPFIAATGGAAALATLSFLLAARAGIVSIAAVIASMSPAVTVVLAWLIIREPLGMQRVAGIIATGVALVAISAG